MRFIVAVFWESLFFFFRSVNGRVSKKNTFISLSFHGDHRTPDPIRKENIFRWYTLKQIIRDTQNENDICTGYTVTIIFDIPVNPCRVRVSASSDNLPIYEVKDFSSRHTIIHFIGEIPACNVEFQIEQD